MPDHRGPPASARPSVEPHDSPIQPPIPPPEWDEQLLAILGVLVLLFGLGTLLALLAERYLGAR